MATLAAIELKILSSFSFDQIVDFEFDGNVLFETARNNREGINTFKAFIDPLPLPVESLAQNYVDAINADYSIGGAVSSNPITASVKAGFDDTVVIEANDFWGYVFDTSIEIPEIQYTIIAEDPPVPEVEVGNIFAVEADGPDKCNTCKYSFEVLNAGPGTYPITISSPVSKTAIDEFDTFFDFDRNHVPQATLTIQPDDGDEVSTLLPTVTTYTLDSVNVLESFGGATVTIITTKEARDVDINLTYSINNIDYQSGNTFFSVGPGNFTAYVRDDLGCEQTLPFTVVGVTVDKPEPIFQIENVNPLKMFPRTTFSLCGERPNFDNSRIIDQGYWNIEKKNYLQLIQQCDNSNIQIKSNYDNIAIDVLDCDGQVVQSPSVTLVKENILQQDKRDCQLKAGSASGKTHIYYISGNTYIPGTTTTDQPYSINNGQLPAFASDGNIASGITIDLSATSLNGVFLVQQSVFDSDINVWCLEINAVFDELNNGEVGITEATYNEEDYNIHEATIDWSIIPEGIYTVQSSATDDDPRYDDVFWDGEYIDLKQEHKRSVLIKYSNPDNIEQADYSTGIDFSIRVPARFVKWRNGGESESFISDDGTREQLKGIVVREVQLESDFIPQYLVEKISIASIHKNLFLNGVECTMNEQGESEDKFSERNPFYSHNAWYQFGSPIEITDATGIISSTGRALEVNGNALGITI